MKYFQSRHIFFTLFFLLFFFLITNVTANSRSLENSVSENEVLVLEGEAILTIAPDGLSVKPGAAQIGVPIILTNNDKTNLTEFELWFTYDNDWLTCTEVRLNAPKSFLKNNKSIGECKENANGDVFIRLDAPSDFTGKISGTIAYIIFDVVSSPPESIPAETAVLFATPNGSTCNSSNLICQNGTILINNPPSVSGLILTSEQENTVLTIDYLLSEPVQNDDEVQKTIRWLRNGQHQPDHANKDTIIIDPSEMNDEWCVQVIPKEEVYNIQVQGDPTQKCTYLNSTPPQLITPPTLTPSYPRANTPLTASILLTDTDSDSTTVRIRWYRGDQLQPFYNQQKSATIGTLIQSTISAETFPGERWCAKFIVEGSNVDTIYWTNCIIINPNDNTLPEVENVQIFPPTPKAGSRLEVIYSIFDFDGDVEDEDNKKTQIRWYRNGRLVPTFNNEPDIPWGVTQAGEEWHVVVQPYDGKGFGLPNNPSPTFVPTRESNFTNLLQSVAVNQGLFQPTALVRVTAIENSEPKASAPRISMVLATNSLSLINQQSANYSLQLDYNYTDVDNDIEVYTMIRWYRNHEYQPQFDGQTQIPNHAIQAGEIWYATIYPHDDQTFGERLPSLAVLLPETNRLNMLMVGTTTVPPAVENVFVSPNMPGDNDNLELRYDFYDANDDPEANTNITWFRNSTLQAGLSGITVVPAYLTSPGDEWYAVVKPNDSESSGSSVKTETITISNMFKNSLPEISKAYIDPGPRAGNRTALELKYDFTDLDNHKEANSIIEWWRKPANAAGFSQIITKDYGLLVPAEDTESGDQWYAKITPLDQLESGEPKKTDIVTINYPPQKPPNNSASLSPMPLAANEIVRVNLKQTFVDGYTDDPKDDPPDPNGGFYVKWYVRPVDDTDGTLVFEGHRLLLDSNQYNAGDEVWAEVSFFDSYDYGPPIKTPRITVGAAIIKFNMFLPLISKPVPEDPWDTYYEPNNRQEDAFSIELKKFYEDGLSEDLDDWYCINLENTSGLEWLSIDITNYQGHGQVVLYKKTDPSSRSNAIRNDGRGQPNMNIRINDMETFFSNNGPGTYLIRIYTSDQRSKDAYKFIIDSNITQAELNGNQGCDS